MGLVGHVSLVENAFDTADADFGAVFDFVVAFKIRVTVPVKP